MELPNIALVGYMRSGKDSVAACLRQLDPHMRQVSFAGALKREVAHALNATKASYEATYTEDFFNEDANRPVFRPLLQWWGTEYRRAQDPDYWVRQTKRYMDGQKAGDIASGDRSSWVCTDGRFINELTMLRKQEFKIIHLDMNVSEVTEHLRSKGLSREDVEKQLGHPSEREWQGVAKDAVFHSQFGNLPRLTYLIVNWLTPVLPEEEPDVRNGIEKFFAELYPALYGTTGKVPRI